MHRWKASRSSATGRAPGPPSTSPRPATSTLTEPASCRHGSSTPGSPASRCPKEYGGAGLTLQHQQAFFDDAVRGRRVPTSYMVSIGMLGPTLLDHGSEELKRRAPAADPPRRRGMDPAAVRAERRLRHGRRDSPASPRDGDTYVLNGAKMWSTGATSRRLRHVPRADRLGRPEAPWPLDDRGAAAAHARRRHRAHPTASTAPRRTSARSSSTTSRSRPRT